MATKKITVEGVGGVKLSSDAEFDKWLGKKGINCLFDNDGDEIVGFDSLVNGGEYTMSRQQQNIQQYQQMQQVPQFPDQPPAAMTHPTAQVQYMQNFGMPQQPFPIQQQQQQQFSMQPLVRRREMPQGECKRRRYFLNTRESAGEPLTEAELRTLRKLRAEELASANPTREDIIGAPSREKLRAMCKHAGLVQHGNSEKLRSRLMRNLYNEEYPAPPQNQPKATLQEQQEAAPQEQQPAQQYPSHNVRPLTVLSGCGETGQEEKEA